MASDTFTVVLMSFRNDGPPLDKAAETALINAHVHYIATLHEQGYLLAAGPLTDPDARLSGLLLYRTDLERTRELAEADPGVAGGRFTVKCLPWTIPAGGMNFTQTTYPHKIS
jgi:uncharacterized protein YciI